jgi:DNA-binding transcriptional MerR regulator
MPRTQSLDIAAVARKSGVTSRTLRHYDAIGLLTPARTGRDGRRYYERPQLLRLQHVLVLRELGTPLGTIQRIIDTDDPSTTVRLLRVHLAALERERERFARMARTVTATITSLENGTTMTADEILDGFDNTPHEPEARARWGDDAVQRSNEAWKALGSEGRKAHLAEHVAIASGLGELKTVGARPDDDAVQALVARHHGWVSVFWTPDGAAYRELGDMYVQDPRFAANYDKHADGLAAFLRDAMHAYANANLS